MRHAIVLLVGLLGCGGSMSRVPDWVVFDPPPKPRAVPEAEQLVVDGPPVVVPQVSGYIEDVRPSPDGKLVAAKTWNGIYIVDVNARITRGFAPIRCAPSIVFSSDSERVFASDCRSNIVHVWNLVDDTTRDVETSFARASLSPRAGATRVLAYSADPGQGMDVVDGALGVTTHVTLDGSNRFHDGEITPDGSAIYAGTKSLVVARPFQPTRSVEYGFDAAAVAIDRAGKLALVENGDSQPTSEDLVVDLSSMTVRRGGHCGAQAVTVTNDGKHIVAACNQGHRLVVTSGAEPLFSQESDERIGSLSNLGPDVLVGHGQSASILRFPSGSPPRSTREPVWMAGLRQISEDGSSFVSGSATGGWTVVDATDGRPLFRLPGSTENTGYRATGNGYLQTDDGPSFDVARRTELDGRLTDDGNASFVCSAHGQRSDVSECRFTPRATGTLPWTIRSKSPLQLFRVSSGGHYLAIGGRGDAHRDTCNVVSFLGASGTMRETDCMGFGWDLSPREDYVATIGHCTGYLTASMMRPQRDGGPTGFVCDAVELTPLAGGAPTSIKTKREAAGATVSFSADGDEVLVGNTIYDVRARKALWSLPEEEFGAELEKPWGAVVSRVEADAGHRAMRFRDAVTGKLLGAAPYRDVDAVSANGAFAILDDSALLDTRSLATTVLPIDGSSLYPSDDGAFVWFSTDDTRFAYRRSDGRILAYVACPECGGHVVMTDEGVTGARRDASSYAIRRGSNVLRSVIELATEFPSERVRPTLEDDFFAGKDVSLPK